MEEENSFLQKDLKPDCDDYEETIENHPDLENEIIEFIEMVIEKKDPGLQARMEKLKEHLIMLENGAGFQIKEEVLNAISLGL